MIFEYKCRECGDTFVGDGEDEDFHIECEAGEDSIGDLVVSYVQTPLKYRFDMDNPQYAINELKMRYFTHKAQLPALQRVYEQLMAEPDDEVYRRTRHEMGLPMIEMPHNPTTARYTRALLRGSGS